ncbi:MAG: hypothetical protein AMJ79_14980 [Phycisphaerae bacterium SM23_30]|nr:MAG: hypothetical protein AMJ79_14980 [Phycisphaerae bacterium SM23_30]
MPGYGCIEVYAHLWGKKVLPLTLDAFSTDDPAVGSQNLQIIRTVQAVSEALNSKGVWVVDRGFDGLQVYEMWFWLNCHFVVRQCGDRHVVVDDGVISIDNAVNDLLHSGGGRMIRMRIILHEQSALNGPTRTFMLPDLEKLPNMLERNKILMTSLQRVRGSVASLLLPGPVAYGNIGRARS